MYDIEFAVYKKMYLKMFNGVSDVIESTTDLNTKRKLIKLQQEAEEIYMDFGNAD